MEYNVRSSVTNDFIQSMHHVVGLRFLGDLKDLIRICLSLSKSDFCCFIWTFETTLYLSLLVMQMVN